MKEEKLQRILANGRYKVSAATGLVYKQCNGSWTRLVGSVLPNGYRQYILYEGRGKGLGLPVYGHHLVWFVTHGKLATLTHLNKIRSDNRIANLVERTYEVDTYKKYNGPIRITKGDKIVRVIQLHLEGKNKSAIARFMGMNRTTVLYLIRNYEDKRPFKYCPELYQKL